MGLSSNQCYILRRCNTIWKSGNKKKSKISETNVEDFFFMVEYNSQKEKRIILKENYPSFSNTILNFKCLPTFFFFAHFFF